MLGNITKSLYWTKALGNTAAGKDVAEVDGTAIEANVGGVALSAVG